MDLSLDKSSWRRVSFGDVVKNINVTIKDPSAEGIDRVIAMEHLDPGELRISRWGYRSDGTTFTRRVQPGQTLFGKRRAYQRKAAYAEFDAICSGDILVFDADSQAMLPEFLPFLVQSEGFYGHALGTSAGSLSPRTNWRDLASYEFDLPPIDEQKSIADLMWSVERHSEKVRHLIASAQRGRLDQIDLLVGSAIKKKAVPLGRLAEIRGGIQKGKRVEGETIERPYLRVANVQAGYLDLENVKTIPVSPADANRFKLEPGDVLMTEGGDIDKLGRGDVWHGQIAGCLHQNHIFAVRPHPQLAASEWICIHTESSHGRKYFLQAGKRTSNLATINKRQVGDFPIGGVAIAEQLRALAHVEFFDSAIRGVVGELAQIKLLKSVLSALIFGDPS